MESISCVVSLKDCCQLTECDDILNIDGGWRSFKWIGETEYAAAIAEAFARNDGNYAW